MIYYAGLHYEKDGHREFVHSMTGIRTLKDEFDKTASHNEHLLELNQKGAELDSPLILSDNDSPNTPALIRDVQ